MSSSVSLDTPSKRKNFAANVLEGALSNQVNSVFISQSAVLPLFIVQHHPAKWLLGLLPAIAYLGNYLPQILGAAFTAKSKQFWPSFRGQMLICRLSLLALAITPWIPFPWTMPAFFTLFAVYCLICGFALPVWNEFMTYVIPQPVRGQFLGWRIALGSALGIAGTWVVSRLLATSYGFGACFGIAALLYSVGYLLILKTQVDWTPIDLERRAANPFWGEIFKLLTTHREFQTYAIARALIAISLGANAFYLVYGMQTFRLSLSQTSLLAIAFTVAPGLSALFWGNLVDRWGTWKVLGGTALLIGLANLAILKVSHLMPFVLCLFLIGCGGVLCTIGDRKWLAKQCPHRGAAIGLFNLLILPAIALSGLLGGAAAEVWGITTVFKIATVAWLLGGAIALLKSRKTSK